MIKCLVRSAIELPRSSATPYSVTTLSTMFLNVVTAAPRCNCGTIRDTLSSAVVECRTMKAWPLLGHHGAAREVRLASGGGPVLAAQRFGGTLPEEVNLE